jgi:hypothetical protein
MSKDFYNKPTFGGIFEPLRWKLREIKGRGCDVCPDCGEDMTPPAPPAACTCPKHIYIPPFKHIHVDCPVHGKRKIHGDKVMWEKHHEMPKV